MARSRPATKVLAAALALGCATAPPPASRTPSPAAPTRSDGQRRPDATRAATPEAPTPPAASRAPSVDGDAHEQHADETPAPAESAGGAGVSDDERRAYEHARPVFDRYCTGCHTTAAGKPGPLRHLNIDSYPFGGHHASGVAGAVRSVLGATGKRPTMPKDSPGVVRGTDLQAVLDWADAFDRAHPEVVHDHSHDHGDQHSHHHDHHD